MANQQDRRHVEVFGKTNWQQVMSSDNLSNILTHPMTAHDLVMIVMILMILGDEFFMTMMAHGEDIVMTQTTLEKVFWWP